MTNPAQLERLFYQAARAVPYELVPTGATTAKGFRADKDGTVDYSEEFIFPICRFLGENISGVCCLSLWQDEEGIEISGSFVAVLNFEWNSDHALPGAGAVIRGEYDLEGNTWRFGIS